jgi:hypothetical protein
VEFLEVLDVVLASLTGPREHEDRSPPEKKLRESYLSAYRSEVACTSALRGRANSLSKAEAMLRLRLFNQNKAGKRPREAFSPLEYSEPGESPKGGRPGLYRVWA